MTTSPTRRITLAMLCLLTFTTAACGASFPEQPASASITSATQTPQEQNPESQATVESTPTAEPTGGDLLASEGAITIDHDPSWTLDGTPGRDRVASVLSTTMGPTDNLSATMGRLSAVDYEFPTLPGTDVVNVDVSQSRDWSVDSWHKSNTMTLTFVNTNGRSDAAATFESALTDMGWDIKRREFTSGDLQITNLNGRAPDWNGVGHSVNIDVFDRVEGGSIVELRFVDNGGADLTDTMVGDGWHRPSPIPASTTFHRFVGEVGATPGGNHDVFLYSEFRSDEDENILKTQIAFSLEETGHEDASASTTGFTSNFHDARTSIFVRNLDLDYSEIYGEVSLQIQQSLIVAAEAPPASATRGTGDAEATNAGPKVNAVALVLAEPNGPTVTANTNTDEVVDQLVSTMTTTTDVPGTVARFGLFPAGVPTLADARITDLRVGTTVDDFAPAGERLVHNEAHVDYLTSATFDDATAAHVDSLTASGWTITQTQNEENDEGFKRVFLTLRETAESDGLTNQASMLVFVGEGEDATTIRIDFNYKRNPDRSGLSELAGWYQSPFVNGETHNVSIGISQFRQTEAFISVGFTERFEGETVASLKPVAMSAFDSSPGWAFTEERQEATFGGVFEALEADASVHLFERDETTAYPNGYAEIKVSIDDVIKFG